LAVYVWKNAFWQVSLRTCDFVILRSNKNVTDFAALIICLLTYLFTNSFRAVDHQWDGNLFATAGAQVDIWDHNRYKGK
ncbi:hypothetical protein, partial [Mycobacterium tuberculosis]